MGQERRDALRLLGLRLDADRADAASRRSRRLGDVVFALVLLGCLVLSGGAALYLFKSVMGLDLLPTAHAQDVFGMSETAREGFPSRPRTRAPERAYAPARRPVRSESR